MRTCPFCDSPRLRLVSRDASMGAAMHTNRQPKFYVRCLACNARGPIGPDEGAARALWDRTTMDGAARHMNLLEV